MSPDVEAWQDEILDAVPSGIDPVQVRRCLELSPTERAAVVLRYAYDMPYAAIGAALGSSEDAARQAASAGVRRLRRKEIA